MSKQETLKIGISMEHREFVIGDSSDMSYWTAYPHIIYTVPGTSESRIAADPQVWQPSMYCTNRLSFILLDGISTGRYVASCGHLC